MQGLNPQQAMPAAQADPAAQPQQQDQQQPDFSKDADMLGAEQKKASPEEQAIYNKFIAFFMLQLYDEKVMNDAIETIKKTPDVRHAIAAVAVPIGVRVYTEAKKQGDDIPGAVVLHAGAEAIELVSELAETALGREISQKEKEGAYYLAADMTRQALENAGMIDHQGVAKDLQALEQASGPNDAQEPQSMAAQEPAGETAQDNGGQ